MSRKYIKQINDLDFVFPNNEMSEYDIEIVHDINDNCVSGSITGITVNSFTSSSLQLSLVGTWEQNNAETFEPSVGPTVNRPIWSLHMLAPGQDYYKPWRTVVAFYQTPPLLPSIVWAQVATILPGQLGIDSFTNGTYYFEMRFIGHRCVYPVCFNLELVLATPTPTPTPTVTPTIEPTPTPTPTETPTPTPTEEGISLQVYGRDIDGTPDTITFFYSVNGGGNINVPGYTGAPFPSTCTLLYTITGLTATDSIVFGTSIACVMEGTTGISSCPSITTSATTYTYIVDAPSTQAISISIDTGTIP